MFKRRERRPSGTQYEFPEEGDGRTPNDLPPRYSWARDELVDLRMRNHELMVENHCLRLELVKFQLKAMHGE